MVVVSAPASADRPTGNSARAHPLRPPTGPSAAVVWHDLECGSYRADLPLWLELARGCPAGAILDVGAGTGRVALELARAGRRVIALDIDPELLTALRARAAGQDIATVCADARSFELSGGESISLCLAPMQTVQLLGGSDERLAFLRRVRAHMQPGGLIACALVSDVEPFDCSDGSLAPSPETTQIDGLRYSSQPTRLEVGRRTIAIERARRIDGPAAVDSTIRDSTAVDSTIRDSTAADCTAIEGIGASTAIERDLIELDRVTAEGFEHEGTAVGLHAEPLRHIPPTDDHAGSTVVVLRV